MIKTAPDTSSKLMDYYSFGMIMPGRSDFSNSDYRYGFNGMESDGKDINGVEKSSYTTTFRQYDPRVGRWWSIDPETSNLASQSPYEAMGNNPVINVDPEGDWFWESKEVKQARRFARATGGDFHKYSRSNRQRTGEVAVVTLTKNHDAYWEIKYAQANMMGVSVNELPTQDWEAFGIKFVEGGNYENWFAPPRYYESNAGAATVVLQLVVVAVPGVGLIMGNEKFSETNVAESLLNASSVSDDNWEKEFEEEQKRLDEALGKAKGKTKENTKGQTKDLGQQHEEIIKAQEQTGKSSPKGHEQNKIRSTKKSKQNLKNDLKKYK